MILELDIQRASDAPGQPSDEDFGRWVEAALAGRREQAELTIRTVDEAESQALNRDYRGKDYPTNVLSFPADVPPEVAQAEGMALLGDLVICTQVVTREAEAQQKALEAHWAHMVVHGTLHLLGYDHEREQEAAIMESTERNLLRELGFADPY